LLRSKDTEEREARIGTTGACADARGREATTPSQIPALGWKDSEWNTGVASWVNATTIETIKTKTTKNVTSIAQIIALSAERPALFVVKPFQGSPTGYLPIAK
jgi:hypothetical protein